MTSNDPQRRWPGRLFRRSGRREPDRSLLTPLTAAFLDMDKRQTFAERAVSASEQLFPEHGMRAAWEPVARICFAASTAYLAATEQFENAIATGNRNTQFAQTSLLQTTRELEHAAREVDTFYDYHRMRLDDAVALLAAVPAVASQALESAANVAARLAGTAATYAGYPSVAKQADALDAAVAALVAARDRDDARAIRAAAARVRSAVAALDSALAAAPARAEEASRAVASVRTRLDAVRTRAERVGPAYSSLLREFAAASSADLANNERDSAAEVEAAAADLAAAHAAMAERSPDTALIHTAAARAHLAVAEERIAAVTDRLALLREVQRDPKAKENAVRFTLRDAQMLAVSRGITAEWASVLDAQLDRIDRIAAGLNGRHPDYWAYVTGLDAVRTFVSGVVSKMKAQSTAR